MFILNCYGDNENTPADSLAALRKDYYFLGITDKFGETIPGLGSEGERQVSHVPLFEETVVVVVGALRVISVTGEL